MDYNKNTELGNTRWILFPCRKSTLSRKNNESCMNNAFYCAYMSDNFKNNQNGFTLSHPDNLQL